MYALKIVWRRHWGRLTRDRDIYEVLHGSALTFLLRLLGFVLLYLLQLMIARMYGASNLGIYSLTITLMNMGVVLTLFGADTAIIRLLAEYRAQGYMQIIRQVFDKVAIWTTLAAFFWSVILYLFADTISNYVFDGRLPASSLRIVAWILPFASLGRLYASAFRALQRVTISLTVDTVGMRFLHILFLLAAIPFFGQDSMILIMLMAIAVVLNTLFGASQWHFFPGKMTKALKPVDSHSEKAIGMRGVITIAMPMFLSSSMELIMSWTDTIMLGIFTNSETVGVYSVIIRLAMVTSFALISINTILSPKFSELYFRKDMAGLKKLILFANRLIFFASAPLNLLVVLLAGPLLSLFGEEFAIGSLALVILCVGQFVNFSTGSVIPLLTMTGHQKTSRNILVFAAVLNVCGNCLLIPSFGITGASIATAFSLIFRDLCASYWAYRYFGFHTWYIPFLSKNYTVFTRRRGREEGGMP